MSWILVSGRNHEPIQKCTGHPLSSQQTPALQVMRTLTSELVFVSSHSLVCIMFFEIVLSARKGLVKVGFWIFENNITYQQKNF